MTPDVRVLPDAAELGRAAAEWLADGVRLAVERSNRATVALAGGSTPLQMYQALAADYRHSVPWDRVQLFWGDERCVPPDHPASNFGQAWRAMLTVLPLPTGNVHRIPAELLPVEDAVAGYDEILRRYFSADDQPAFDLVLLGLGDDGHTASLFPGDAAVGETARWVIPVFGPPTVRPRVRITLTLPILRRARRTAFLVAGASKRSIVAAVLRGRPEDPGRHPAGLVTARESVVWFLDRAACPESELGKLP